MSNKIEISLAAAICQKRGVEPAKLRAIVEDMNIEAQPAPGDEKEPAVKKQFVVLVSDPAGELKGRLRPDGTLGDIELVGWVLQVPESEAPQTITHRIADAAATFNASKRGRILPVVTVGEALENVPSKHFKEVETWVKTKTPVLIVTTDNRIDSPKDDTTVTISTGGNSVTMTGAQFHRAAHNLGKSP